MRILHAYKIYRPDVNGGIPAVIAMLCRYRPAGTSHEIVTARRVGWFRRYAVDDVPVTATTSFGSLFSMPLAPTFPWHLLRRSKAADIVIHHAPFPLTDLAIAVAFPRSSSLIVYWHAEIVGRSLLRHLIAPLLKRALDRADRILVSDDRIAQHSPLVSSHRHKTTAVPYGVDTAYWATIEPSQQGAVDELRRTHPRLIVAIGRLVSYKGYDVLLNAMREVDGQAIVIGDGPLLDKLEAMAVELGVSDRVAFRHGLDRDQVKIHLHAARLLVMPSVSAAEAFGIVQIEAMAAGRPVINTDLPTAVPLVARDGLEGLTVPPRDPHALGTALNRLLCDPVLAERLGTAAQARAVSEYDESRFLERMKTVYQELRPATEADETR